MLYLFFFFFLKTVQIRKFWRVCGFFYSYQLWNLAWEWSCVLHEWLRCDDDLLSTFPYESHLVNSLWFVNLQAAYWIEIMDCVAKGTDFSLPVGLISNDSFVVSVGGWEASSLEFSVFFCFSLNLELSFSNKRKSCCSVLCCSQCSVSAKHFLLAVNKHISVCLHLSLKCWKTSAYKNETNALNSHMSLWIFLWFVSTVNLWTLWVTHESTGLLLSWIHPVNILESVSSFHARIPVL